MLGFCFVSLRCYGELQIMETLKRQIKERARELGFAACGIAPAAPSQTHEHLENWLQNGFQAGMNWMARPDAIEKRGDLRKLWPAAKSVICVALHYRTEAEWDDEKMGKIARYARGMDYHEIIVPRLRDLLAWIQTQTPCEGRAYSDTGPISERDLGQRAGIGWIGKNSMLMSRELGSYFLLGELLLDIELPPDTPHLEQFCGSCTRCMDACPTDAIIAPRVLDANKCISYHTIENRQLAPKELRDKFGDWIFGCDICQEVCPWNHKSQAHSEETELWTREEMPSLLEWLMLPQEEFSRRLKKSPIKRAKRRGMRRNAARTLRARRKL